MKISLNWIGDFITWKETNPQEIARIITAHVAEVDEVEVAGRLLENCCVGKVLSIDKHPNADKLTVCMVQTDQGDKKVVCGGSNLRKGMKVAFAHVGAKVLWHGGELMTLEKTKIRGEESEGMICAAEELELGSLFPAPPEHGPRPVVDLGDGSKGVGTSLKEYLGMNDAILHIDNHAITHRADLFSHIGFARECVAIGLGTWKKKLPDYTAPKFSRDNVPFKLEIEREELMPRYCACVIEIDSLGETPDWMKKRLEVVGWRPLNLPIDITNFVASEVGVPLHSFDLDDLKGDVHMRVSTEGEKIVTLDEKERTLPAGALVLSDDEGIFDLLGIMGGLRSSTKPTTKRIYLHSASLDPVAIRRTVIATGHRTDAATVYEKGVPHITTEEGFNRAVHLFLELVPGARVVSELSEKGDNGKATPITISVKRVQSVLGAQISSKEMQKILKDLEFEVSAKGDTLTATPPLMRLGDVEGSHDLVEEIGRIYGYNKIEATLPSASTVPPERDQRINHIRDALKEQACIEILPLSFVGPDLLAKAGFEVEGAVGVQNAIGTELSLMAPSVLPRLLEHAEASMLQVETNLKTFTIAHTFPTLDGETMELGILIAARQEPDIYTEPFLVASHVLRAALRAAGYEATLSETRASGAYMHPGRTASIHVGGTTVGTVYEIHPEIQAHFDLPQRAAAVSLNLISLLAHPASTVVAEHVPQFPAVSYDLTVTMDQKKSSGDLLAKIRSSSSLLESVEVADLYSGKPLTGGQYNLTIRCTYRSPERTLTDAEVKAEHEKVLKLLNI